MDGQSFQAMMDAITRIGGPVNMDRGLVAGIMVAVIGVITAMQMLAYLGMTSLLVWKYRTWASRVLQETRTAFWPSVGKGLLFAILTPISVGLLVMSFVGIIPGVLVALGYVALLVLAKVVSGMFLGAWLWSVVNKKPTFHVTWVNALAGAVLIYVIVLVPVIGMLASTVIMLAVFGVVSQMAVRHFWK